MAHARTITKEDVESPRPVYAVWEITMCCDHACAHCGSRAAVARPDELFFGDVEIASGIESRLEIDIHSKAGIELVGAETTVPGVLVELGSALGDEGETHYLMVLLTPDLLTGPFRGVVRVKTSSIELPVLEIPISGVAH